MGMHMCIYTHVCTHMRTHIFVAGRRAIGPPCATRAMRGACRSLAAQAAS